MASVDVINEVTKETRIFRIKCGYDKSPCLLNPSDNMHDRINRANASSPLALLID